MSTLTPADHYSYVTPIEGETYSNRHLRGTAGDPFRQEYEVLLPLTSSINLQYYNSTYADESDSNKLRLSALINTTNRHKIYSPHFEFSNSEWNKLNQELTLISIPSIFFGSSIKRNSVSLQFNYSGSTVCRLEDVDSNGELIEVIGNNTGSVAGVVLYNSGFIILTGSWSCGNNFKWNHFGTGNPHILASGSFDLNFNGVNQIPTITMFANAPKGELNHSNNLTYIDISDREKTFKNDSNYFKEENVKVKNVTKYPYDNYTGSVEKITYISSIGIFDENRNLIGTAKLAKPVKKTDARDFTFKIKLDM